MKPLFVISCPFDTYSGYGARARDIVKSIIELDKYDVRLLSQRWGNTPFGFCEDHPEWKFLLNRTLPNNQLPKQPDVWMQITVPNEFQPVGKYNIGCTAGMETTLVHGTWVEGMNRMDINFVSSEHSKQSFLNSVYEKKDKNGSSVKVQIEKPIEVLFEGANLDVYKPLKTPMTNDDLFKSLKDIPESFAYLFVGHWMQGELGEDRKNVGLLIKAFLEVFKNKKKRPALILKTSQVGSSYMDKETILKRIETIKKSMKTKNLPKIYLLHGEFSNEEMNELYNHPKVKAMINLTKGEGFGRPLLEFSLSKKPIIASGWSGHMDFLDSKFTVCLGGELKNVHPSAVVENMILPESQWFSPDHSQIGHALKDVFENYKNYTDGAKRQAYKSKTEFSWDKMKDLVDELLTKYIPEFPKEVKLELPKLNKISLPKKPTLNG
jgi:glycosyltransferase involved in cell wall biosynthesis